MRTALLALALSAPTSVAAADREAAETREQYLARLTEICSVECMQPRPFQRAARRKAGKADDMALIMDVAFVRRNGERFELFNIDVSSSPLEVVELLRSAGIDASQSTGVAGLPRGRRGALHPDVIVVSLDAQAFSDILNPIEQTSDGAGSTIRANTDAEKPSAVGPDGRIVVEGEAAEPEEARREPNLTNLRTVFRNRRIVVRGKPELTAQWIGGRLDRRRKQVTLLVDNADDLVMLPRYNAKGEAILDGTLAGLTQVSSEDGR